MDRAKLVEDILRGITVPGFDVDIVSCGAVTRFRISRDGKKVAVFVGFTGSDPGCPFCKFVNYTVWCYNQRVEEVEGGFQQII